MIRYEGPKGGPGMREMLNPTSAIAGMGLGSSVALITDGVSQVLPEVLPSAMFLRKLLSAVRSHLSKRAILSRSTFRQTDWNWQYLMKSWQEEKANWTPREPKVKTGYLARYASMVTSGNRGAILVSEK